VRTSGDLTKIFLGEPRDPRIFERHEVPGVRVTIAHVLPATIEPLHDECALIAELTDVRAGHR
jgi:hypothetical protein